MKYIGEKIFNSNNVEVTEQFNIYRKYCALK